MVAAASLHWPVLCLRSLTHFSICQWRVPAATPLIVLLAATGILMAFLAVRQRRLVAIGGLTALFVSASIVAFYSAAPRIESGKLEVTAIDVGQGDSLL